MYRTIPQLLLDAAGRDPGGIWLRSEEDSWTFAEAVEQAAAKAHALREKGIRHGDLVLLTARNTPAHLFTWLGIVSLGAIAVTVDRRSTKTELDGLVAQTRPRAVITEPPETSGARSELPTDVGPDDVAVLIPTSGTTGRSKLVMQTHRAYTLAGEGFPYWMGLTAADRLMTSLPLFHINAPAYSVMGSLACGAGLVLLSRFSASGFLDAARRHGATEFNSIGAMLEMLMRQPERPDDADNPLRVCYTGPSPTQERQEEIERRFGLRLICGYGMSETTYGLIWPHGTRPFGTLGTPRQHPTLGTINEARVMDGELQLRNPAVTPGYWNMPEETSKALVDGWLHTGDLVTPNDDGTYTFVARAKEVLRRRGENLSPLEVEEALTAHPDVLECAVVGVPSELSEDEVKAFVVPVPGARPDFAELRAWAAQRLTAFKVPRYWQLLGELPRTPTSRVAKHLLPQGHPDGEEEHL